MNKLFLVIFFAITMLFAIPFEGYARNTSVFVSAHYKGGHGHGYSRGHYGGHRHYYRGHHYRGHHYRWHHHPGHRYFWSGSIVIPWYPCGYPAPPPVVIQKEPQVHVQPEQGEENYWYYCPDPQGYYPYIRECASGWMKVVPDATPPNQ